MTRPDFITVASEIVTLAKGADSGAVTHLIALKLELMFEAGRGAGLDEGQALLFEALARVGRKPS